MSTKKISRSLIEGGKTNYDKWEIKNSNQKLRAKTREYISNINKNIDHFDSELEPSREKIRKYKFYNYKSKTLRRWLRSNVGKPWDDVRSEMSSNLDVRSNSVNFIFYKRFLKFVEETPDLRFGRWYKSYEDFITSFYDNDFYVDENGFLQKKIHKLRYRNFGENISNVKLKEIEKWLNSRLIGYVGDQLYWLVPVLKTAKYGRNYFEKIKLNISDRYIDWSYFYNDPIYEMNNGIAKVVGHKPIWKKYNFASLKRDPYLRQDCHLSKSEIGYYNLLSNFIKEKITVYY